MRSKSKTGKRLDAKKATRKPPTSGQPAKKMPMPEFSRSLPMALLRAREAMMRHFRPSLRDRGLTEQQWRILRALTSIESIEVSELARVTCLLGPSLSRILRDLEIRQLVQRRSPENDLRRGIVSILPAGFALIDTVAPVSEAIYETITKRYGAKKLELLHAMLRELEMELLAIPVEGAANAQRS